MALSEEKKKAIDVIRQGGYVEDVTDALDITVHGYYRMRHQDAEFDRKAKKAMAQRTTPYGKDTDTQMFIASASEEDEVDRRTQILQILRRNAI